ncbi:hypothetical protein C0992_011183, partial [Termitomyces sp. T32_za158]
MFFLRRAHELYNDPQKSLSPSFWESEGPSPLEKYGIDAIMSGIEYPLGMRDDIHLSRLPVDFFSGRLLYTTGDVASAVRYFLGLLRRATGKLSNTSSYPSTGSDDENKLPGADKVYLDDFRVAYATELFWVDLVLRNPLNTEVNLSNLTVIVQESNAQSTSASTAHCVEVEVINNIVLGAQESQT